LDRWRTGRGIGWISDSGLIKKEGGFTFTERPDGVRIELRIVYEPPAAVLGAAVARRLDGVIRRRLETALERIRKVLESESLKSRVDATDPRRERGTWQDRDRHARAALR